MEDVKLALDTARKGMKITLVSSLIFLMLGICLVWLMLNNTVALAQVTKERDSLKNSLELLEKRVAKLEGKSL